MNPEASPPAYSEQSILVTPDRGGDLSSRLHALYRASHLHEHIARYERLATRLSGISAQGNLSFYSTPGRTELGGNHTDHNHGRVLCAAIHLDAVAAVRPRDDRIIHIVSEGYERPIEIHLDSLQVRTEERGTTQALLRGVAAALVSRYAIPAGSSLKGFNAVIHSEVLPGSGLSSSAAIEVLLATILADVSGILLNPTQLAMAGQFAENDYFGKPCGLMDQMACAYGGISAIDFASPDHPEIQTLEFDLESLGYSLVVVNTGGSHADLTDEYAAIPTEMRAVAHSLGAHYLRQLDPADLHKNISKIRSGVGDRALLRALHFFAENTRVTGMMLALKSQNLARFLELVQASGSSSWRYLQNLNAPSAPREQGPCLALALAESLPPDPEGRGIVSRIHGGGFAGTIQAYVPQSLLEVFTQTIEQCFGKGAVMPLQIRPSGSIRVQ